jgi:TolA-binding protein
MLGVVPPEILQQYGNPDQKIPYKSLPEGVTEKPLKPSLEEKQKSLASEKQASTPEKENESALLKKSHPDDSEYIELLKVAQEKFNQGSYGQAIAEYQRLSETFPELIKHGQHLYWIGLSWFYLKEDRMASDAFNDLQKNYPQSPFVGRSSLYLARIDVRSGLRKRALGRLRRIIQEFPSDEVAEMARFELERMKEGI